MNICNIEAIDSGGNGYYKCLSWYLYRKVYFHESLRKTIIIFLKENLDKIYDIFLNTKDYINNIETNNYWAKEIEIPITTYLFRLNIGIYSYSNNRKYLEFSSNYIYNEDNMDYPLMILVNENSGFEGVFPYKQKRRKWLFRSL